MRCNKKHSRMTRAMNRSTVDVGGEGDLIQSIFRQLVSTVLSLQDDDAVDLSPNDKIALAEARLELLKYLKPETKPSILR